MGGDLRDGGCPALALGEVADGLGQRQLQLLESARHPHRPSLVAEVTLDLAHDGGCRVGGELHPPLEVEPVDRFDQADGGDLGQVVQPFAPVAEPPSQVFDQRKVQLDQFAADAQPLSVIRGQRGEPLEQVPGPAPVRDGMLDFRGGVQLSLGHLSVESLGDRDLDVLGHLRADALSQPGLGFPGHPGLDDSRIFLSMTVTPSPGPTHASTLPASAESTVQAKVSRAGGRGCAATVETAMLILSSPRVKSHSRSAPGAAWASSMPQASSTAMRRSSISSRVKSSGAARPAVAVRRTDRYAPSAGMRMVTWSWTEQSAAASPSAITAVGATVALRAVVSPVTASSTGGSRPIPRPPSILVCNLPSATSDADVSAPPKFAVIGVVPA